MKTVATCAVCGEKKELCGSARIDGIQQPRYCKDCLIIYMQTGNAKVNDMYWILQMSELDDKKSMLAIRKQVKEATR